MADNSHGCRVFFPMHFVSQTLWALIMIAYNAEDKTFCCNKELCGISQFFINTPYHSELSVSLRLPGYLKHEKWENAS